MSTTTKRKITFNTSVPAEETAQSRAEKTEAAAAAFWATAPSLRQLSADPALLASVSLQRSRTTNGDHQEAPMPLTTTHVQQRPHQYIDVDGPIDAEATLIRYDIPFAPKDPKRSLRLRKKLGLTTNATSAASGTTATTGSSSTFLTSGGAGGQFMGGNQNALDVDPNVRVVLDSFIIPRRWVDKETGVEWVQHASPFPGSRTSTMETQRRLREKLALLGAKRTGTCPIRTVLVAECFLEVVRQVVTECWERGLLLLHVHTERVAAQATHRELFESRVGHAMRLALKGEKDATYAEEDIAALQAKVKALEEEEHQLKTLCADFSAYAEEQTLIEEKQHGEALNALKKEGLIKRNQLEQMLTVPPPQ